MTLRTLPLIGYLVCSIHLLPAQVNISKAEASLFLTNFLQTLQFEQSFDRKEKIAQFLDPESKDLYLNQRYFFTGYTTYKVESIEPPYATILAAKSTGRFWRYQLSIELIKEEGELYLKCRHEKGRTLNFIKFWQKEASLKEAFSTEDQQLIKTSLKNYLEPTLKSINIQMDTSLLFNQWRVDTIYYHDRGSQIGEPTTELIDWYGGHVFKKNGAYQFYPFAKFAGNPSTKEASSWELYGQFLLINNTNESKWSHWELEELSKDQMILTLLDRGDTTRFHYIPQENFEKRATVNTTESIRASYTNLDTSQYSFLFPPTVDKIIGFNPQYIQVKRNGLYGLIDQTGKEVVPIEYQEVRKAIGAKDAYFKSEDQWYRFKDGQLQLDSNFQVEQFSRQAMQDLLGIQTSKDGNEKIGKLSSSGDTIIAYEYDMIQSIIGGNNRYFEVSKNGLTGLVRKDGKVILEPIYDTSGPDPSEFPYMIIKKEGKKGFFHVEKETWIIPPEYDQIHENDSVIMASLGAQKLFFDLNGEIIRFAIFEPIYAVGINQFVIEQEGQQGVIDRSEAILMPPIYDEVRQLSVSRFKVKQGNFWGIYDLNDALIIPIIYEEIIPTIRPYIQDDLRTYPLIYQENGRRGIIDWKGEKITGNLFTYIGSIDTSTLLLPVYSEKGAGLINWKGVEVLPLKYAEVDNHYNGYYTIGVTDEAFDFLLKGLVNKKGEVIVPPVFEELEFINNGSFQLRGYLPEMVAVKYNNRWGILKL